jgi:hypothetical protein
VSLEGASPILQNTVERFVECSTEVVNKRWFKIGRNRRKDKYISIQAVKYSTTYNRKGFLFILRRIGLGDMASADLTSGNLQLQKSFRELPRGKSHKISNHLTSRSSVKVVI